MSTAVEKLVDIYAANIDKYAEAYNKAFREKDMTALMEAETNLKGELKRYAGQKATDVANNLAKAANPIKEAISQMTYEIKASKKTRNEGVETGVEIVSKDVPIDLVAVCNAANLPTAWVYSLEYLAYMIAVNITGEINNKITQKALKTDYRMKEMARKMTEGQTPTSKTQIVKYIQNLVDTVCPGLGKVNNHDFEYLKNAMSTGNKKELKDLKLGSTKDMQIFFLGMCNQILTNSGYTVSYKKERAKDSGKKTETAPADAPKTDAPEQPAAETAPEQPAA